MSDLIPATLDPTTFIQPINYGWKQLENEKGYPVPQGKMPMMQSLTQDKQLSLLLAYNQVLKTQQ